MSKHGISLTVNGFPVRARVEAHRTLLEFLRNEMDLTGAKECCGNGECGACTVIVDGKALRSCLVLAVEVDGATITTIEGVGRKGELHPVQQAFIDTGAVQCGYCTPGFVMAAKALLDANPDPSEEEILDAFSGHICRCSGYAPLVEGVKLAARRMAGADDDSTEG